MFSVTKRNVRVEESLSWSGTIIQSTELEEMNVDFDCEMI